MVILAIIVLLTIVLLANVGLQEERARAGAHILITATNVSLAFIGLELMINSGRPPLESFMQTLDPQLAQAFQQAASGIGLLCLLTALLATLLQLARLRIGIATGMRLLRVGSFDAASPVHMVALVLNLYLLASIMAQWLLAGGVSGLAELAGPVGLADVLLNGVLALIFAFFGVGLWVRRSWTEVLERLGLAWPRWQTVLAGTGAAIGFLGLLTLVSGLWYALAPQQFDALSSATDVLFGGFDSLSLALVVAGSTAIGEEVLFRGALQPRFGLLPTALLFAVLHVQYTLSPATLIVFLLGLGLGLLRKYLDTSAAIIAHFVYNFALLMLASVIPQL